jgi:protease-4
MKSFLKTTLASTLGALIALVVMTFVIVGIITGMVAAFSTSSTSKAIVIVEPNTIVSLKLDKPIVDHPSNNPSDLVQNLIVNRKNNSTIALKPLLNGIKTAASDDNVKGLYLDVSELQAGIAVIEELRSALLDFKESGKFLIAYGESYGQGAYYLASAADKMYLNPVGIVDWRGLGGHILFYKGTLQKFGIEAEVYRHGKFKGAVEPFMFDKISPENRTQILSYAGGIWRHWLEGVEKQRKIPVQKQHEIAAGFLLKNAKTCVELGFVDDLKYKDEIISELAQLTEQPKDTPKMLHILDYAGTASDLSPRSKDKLALVYAEGEISMQGSAGIIGNDLARELRALRKDSSVKAVVLRVNSPGGDGFASDLIWREMDLLRQVKPVVVSMGNYAASGGYYIACAATKIVANPTTITGSIGVFGLMFKFERGARERLGITSDIALTEPNADLYNAFRASTPVQKAYIQNSVDDFYGTFVKHVSAGRAMDYSAVDAIAEGRVWNGIDAKRLGLVDKLGGLQDAIDIAVDLASLTDYRLQEYPKQKGTFDFVIELFGNAKARLSAPSFDEMVKLNFVKKLQQQHGKPQARMPYDEDFEI